MKLTEDEKIVLELYRKCAKVEFYIFDAFTDQSKEFVAIAGVPRRGKGKHMKWWETENGKITATGFFHANL